jgi:hypothetical protein
MPIPRPDNLRPPKTKEEARARGRNGGIKSGIARREKRLLSQIYADFLAKEHEITLKSGEKKRLSGAKMVEEVVKRIIAKGESHSVSMMKEIREATEGTKSQTTLQNADGTAIISGITVSFVSPHE